MQGSHAAKALHVQDYRTEIQRLLQEHLPEAEVYDPLANHRESLGYDKQRGREVFFQHNYLCREIDVLVAYVPEASMGTAIEMWEAHEHGATVIAVSPMKHNWAVKFLSHALYADLDELAAALSDGTLRRRIDEVLARR
ncbi:MAG: hypothetical protein JXB10_03845 [Pirellulales bacterium]|nr:hypothetical protein [Pirellulales bacterium]